MLTPEQIAERMTGLGGSDMGAVLGLSDYRNATDVWKVKTGRATDQADTLLLRFGSYAESFVADEYTRMTGRRVQRFNAMLRHPSAPLVGHVDRLVCLDGKTRASHKNEIRTDRGLECKTANAYAIGRNSDWGDAGTDQVPPSYLVQCAVYRILTGCPHWDLAALFGGSQELRIYPLDQDAELEAMVIEEACRFWRDHIVADVPPDPRSEAEARQRWARHQPGKFIEADDALAESLHILAATKRERAALERSEQELRDRIIPALADADGVTWRGLQLCTYRANKDTARTDWKAVSEALDAPPELIAAHTTIAPGARVLRLAKELSV